MPKLKRKVVKFSNSNNNSSKEENGKFSAGFVFDNSGLPNETPESIYKISLRDEEGDKISSAIISNLVRRSMARGYMREPLILELASSFDEFPILNISKSVIDLPPAPIKYASI